MTVLRASLSTAAVLLLITSSVSAQYVNKFGNCQSSEDTVYTLPDTPLGKINPNLFGNTEYDDLVKAGCPDDRDDGSVCFNKPAIGSGFTQLFPNYFLGLTDRGPNQDCEDLYALDAEKYASAAGKSGKGFPVPKFAPAIVHMSMSNDGSIVQRKAVPLKGTDGKPISGLSNTAADDTPYGPNCAGDKLAYDPSGLDTEDIARVSNTDYVAIVDEYSPSIVIANYKTGVIASRNVPRSLGTALSNATYPIINDIPDVYTNRRKNRGFEAVVVDRFSKYAIAIVQSPMLGANASATENNAIIRCAYFTMAVVDGVPSLTYNMSFIIEASPPSAYANAANVPKDMKYSAAQYRTRNTFIALERAKGQVKLFRVDFRQATNIDDTPYADNLDLEAGTNGRMTAMQMGVRAASKTLVWDSLPGVGGTVDFSGGSKQEGFAIDMVDDSKLWIVQDNDFGLEGNGAAKVHKVSLGRAPDGATVCAMPAHPPAPSVNVVPTRKIRLRNPSTYRIADEPDGGAAENLDVSIENQRAYVANDLEGTVDKYDVSIKPARPLKSYKPDEPYIPTSVSVCDKRGLIAVGLANDDDDAAPGRIDVIDPDMNVIRKMSNKDCVLVDSVRWTDDCKFLVGACEGEGKDVPGGIMVADYGGPSGQWFRGVKVATFKAFDASSRFFAPNGVRLIESDVPSVDLEPEYVATSGNFAFVTLQENNAIAVVDLIEGVVTELKPIGFIDRSRKGFAFDASDKDDKINVRRYRNVMGMPQPDTIQVYTAADSMKYLVFANEGDAKDSEEYRCKDITDADELGRKMSKRLTTLTQNDKLLGRLKFSSVMGYNATTNTQDKIYHFGSRSFSIMAMDGSIVFDSGDWFARIQRRYFKKIFNANQLDDEDLSKSMEDLFDNRSDDKGMEPESLYLMTTDDGTTYAFIGFERPSTIVVFDISDPKKVKFVFAVNNNPTGISIEQMFAEGKQGDLDPEGLVASASLKKLFVSGSVSNTLTQYDIVGL